jgi:tRNA(adenine34) deaminase
MKDSDHHYMGKALAQAKEALCRGDFPVGCVVVANGRVVAAGARTASRGSEANELDHAEMVALRRLADAGISTELAQATLYSTMEPCLMCFGAIVLSGIRRIVYAYEDVMGGGASLDLERFSPLYRNSGVRVVGGIRRSESLALFVRFFQNPENDYWRGSLLARHCLGQGLETGG